MLSFASSLRHNVKAFAIFVNEKYEYKDKKAIIPNTAVQKINSFLTVLKNEKKEDEIMSFDLSNQQKCFVVKVKKKYGNCYPEEKGAEFFSYLTKFKDTTKLDLYIDSLDLDKDELINFFPEFIFGFGLNNFDQVYGIVFFSCFASNPVFGLFQFVPFESLEMSL